MWLLDQKYVAKGFSVATEVHIDGEAFRSSAGILDIPGSKQHGDRLLLGSISLVLHNTSALAPAIGVAGSAAVGTVSVGIALYAHRVSPEYFVRLYVSAKGDGKSYFSRGISTAASVVSEGDNIEGTDYEVVFPVESKLRSWGQAGYKGELLLEIDYVREITTGNDTTDIKKSMSSIGSVQYVMRVRIGATAVVRTDWDLEVPIDVSSYIRLQGGNSAVGLLASGFLADVRQHSSSEAVVDAAGPKPSCFVAEVRSFEFKGRGALATYPVASSFTATRFPATFNRLESMLSRYRAWMTLKLNFKFPDIFLIVFDTESINAYERIFSMLMKVIISEFYVYLFSD
jgi:hypothetical protein